MSVTSTTRRKQVTEPGAKIAKRSVSNDDVVTILSHLDALGVRLEILAVAPDGALTLTTDVKIDGAQLEHLGLEIG